MSKLKSVSDVVLIIFYDDKDDGYHMHKWLSNNNIEFSTLQYTDQESKAQNLETYNNWLSKNPDYEPFDTSSFVIYKCEYEEDEVTVLYNDHGRPIYTTDSNGNIIISHTVEKVINTSYKIAETAEELEQSSLLEDILLLGK